MIKRGAVYWVRLDPIEGSEIGKTRPAVIISNDINNQFADTITVVPITTTTERIYPFEAFVPKGTGNLKDNSKAKANQIRTINKTRLGDKLGVLPEDIMSQIEKAIKIHLGIPA